MVAWKVLHSEFREEHNGPKLAGSSSVSLLCEWQQKRLERRAPSVEHLLNRVGREIQGAVGREVNRRPLQMTKRRFFGHTVTQPARKEVVYVDCVGDRNGHLHTIADQRRRIVLLVLLQAIVRNRLRLRQSGWGWSGWGRSGSEGRRGCGYRPRCDRYAGQYDGRNSRSDSDDGGSRSRNGSLRWIVKRLVGLSRIEKSLQPAAVFLRVAVHTKVPI